MPEDKNSIIEAIDNYTCLAKQNNAFYNVEGMIPDMP